jgi:hypothetical protein
MNKRIKEFALQAGSTHKQNLGVYQFYTDELEKFAELIVMECVSVVDGMADPEEDSDRYFWAIQNASHQIKQHFGVEVKGE